MSRQIIWAPLSENDLTNILEYLNKEWGDKVASQFIDVLEQLLIQIGNNPKQFPPIFRKEKIRKCVVTKHNALYYRFNKKQIDILRIYDARQDPKRLKF